MIKTILVDDETHAIVKMEYLLAEYKNYEIIGRYTNAKELIQNLDTLHPQVAFLDIAMPEMSGIELATYLKQYDPAIQIVFVTAYDQYAVTAFELYATDYLLKPITKKRFAKTIDKLNSILMPTENINFPSSRIQELMTSPMVHAFGKLEITGTANNAMPVWRTAKSKELFALFLQNRPNGIYRNTLLETLWEDLPEDKALANLNTCNYYLRKYLEQAGSAITLLHESGYYKIDLGHALCDLDIFMQAEEESTQITETNLEYLSYAADLYRGRYFEDVKCTWANLMRDRYDIRHAILRVRLATYYKSIQDTNRSVNELIRALETDPLNEEAWTLLLDNYQDLNDMVHYKKALENKEQAYKNAL
ncbi:MAG: response regulator [Lachnospiraceae bacterium]